MQDAGRMEIQQEEAHCGISQEERVLTYLFGKKIIDFQFGLTSVRMWFHNQVHRLNGRESTAEPG